jgi:hypothetical protein
MPRILYDWEAIQAYHDEGHGFVEWSRRFGFCHTAWIKAIKRGALRVAPTRFPDRRRKYDWAEVQRYYDSGGSYRKCQAAFGFCARAWAKAVQRGELKPRRNIIHRRGSRIKIVTLAEESQAGQGRPPAWTLP